MISAPLSLDPYIKIYIFMRNNNDFNVHTNAVNLLYLFIKHVQWTNKRLQNLFSGLKKKLLTMITLKTVKKRFRKSLEVKEFFFVFLTFFFRFVKKRNIFQNREYIEGDYCVYSLIALRLFSISKKYFSLLFLWFLQYIG